MSVATTYSVTGMTCGHCARAVTDEVSAIPAVEKVDVDVDSGRVAVTSTAELDDAAVRAAVEDAGYTLTDRVA